MTAAALVAVYCDTCGPAGSQLATADTATNARRQLAGRGWLLNARDARVPDRRLDFCRLHRGADLM